MKRIIVLFSSIALFSFFYEANGENNNPFKAAVEAQKHTDEKNRKEIIEKMHAIIGGFNKRLKDSGVNGADLSSPVNDKDVSGVKKTTDYHSSTPVKKAIAYSTEKIDLYDTPDAKVTVGSTARGEELEILGKNAERSDFRGKAGRWFLARKENQDEGWIHSSFLSRTKSTQENKTVSDKTVSDKVSPPVKEDNGFDLPVEGRRTSNFGYRVDPFTKKQNAFHSGIDIAAPTGTPVSASQTGVIHQAGFNKGGYGNLIVIEHAKDFATYYGHLSKINILVGQNVKKGENIGAVGMTGAATGPHLHFEVRHSEKALDPDSVLR